MFYRVHHAGSNKHSTPHGAEAKIFHQVVTLIRCPIITRTPNAAQNLLTVSADQMWKEKILNFFLTFFCKINYTNSLTRLKNQHKSIKIQSKKISVGPNEVGLKLKYYLTNIIFILF